MLPSLNQLADGFDDAAIKARAATVALLLGELGLQDSFYTGHSITAVIARLEDVQGVDAGRIGPALQALKHLRDVLEMRDQLSREVTTERTSSDPIDINDADDGVGGPSSFSRPQSSLGGGSVGGSGSLSLGGGGGGSGTFGPFGGGGGFGNINSDAADELRRLSLADEEASAPNRLGRPSGEFGSSGFSSSGFAAAAATSGGWSSGDLGLQTGFSSQGPPTGLRAGSFDAAGHGAWPSGDARAASFGGRASPADPFFGAQPGGAPAGSPPCGNPAAAGHPRARRTLDSHSPGASMRMLQSDLRKVALTDDTQDDFYGSL